jgi:hypothetical protein
MTVNRNHLLNKRYNKEQLMTGFNKTEQFLHENISWKRLLYFFTQENSFLKTRLSEVVDRENDQLFIAHAEQFQNEFVLKDEYILDISKDIKVQQENLQQAFADSIAPDQKTCKIQAKLRNEMSYLETEFSDLKKRFNIFLLSIV